MKVCVLQPDYSTTGVDYKNYDPPRDLSALVPDYEVHNVFLNKLTTYKQLKQLGKEAMTFCQPVRRVPRMGSSQHRGYLFHGTTRLSFYRPYYQTI